MLKLPLYAVRVIIDWFETIRSVVLKELLPINSVTKHPHFSAIVEMIETNIHKHPELQGEMKDCAYVMYAMEVVCQWIFVKTSQRIESKMDVSFWLKVTNGPIAFVIFKVGEMTLNRFLEQKYHRILFGQNADRTNFEPAISFLVNEFDCQLTRGDHVGNDDTITTNKKYFEYYRTNVKSLYNEYTSSQEIKTIPSDNGERSYCVRWEFDRQMDNDLRVYEGFK